MKRVLGGYLQYDAGMLAQEFGNQRAAGMMRATTVGTLSLQRTDWAIAERLLTRVERRR